MNYREKYEQWLTFDEETKAELLSITDEKEIEDRFYKDLAFGTGGLRGIMGAGSNRMNKYTVGKATYGLAKYLMKKHEGEEIKVAIRNVRRDANDKCKQMKKNSQMTEDEQKTSEKQIQDLTDSYIKKVDAITAGKVKEIMEI